MSLYHYTVSRVRAAACCPRIHYFDAEDGRRKGSATRPLTRIWTEGDAGGGGGGKLFHTVVERFNREAAKNPLVSSALQDIREPLALREELMRFINTTCIDHAKLRQKSVAVRQSFVQALGQYVAEVAQMLTHAIADGVAPDDVIIQVFGDDRKRVDATFHVGDDARVHVTGTLDYVYQDPTGKQHRIVDYKVLPPTHPNKDIWQLTPRGWKETFAPKSPTPCPSG